LDRTAQPTDRGTSDREGARDRIRSFAIWYGAERGLDLSGGWAEVPAVLMSTLAGGQLTRDPFRRSRRALSRARRWRRSLVAGSPLATSMTQGLGRGRARLGRRFWGDSDPASR